MKTISLLILVSLLASACAHLDGTADLDYKWIDPKARSLEVRTKDSNECTLESLKVPQRRQGVFFSYCLKARGYEWQLVNKDNEKMVSNGSNYVRANEVKSE